MPTTRDLPEHLSHQRKAKATLGRTAVTKLMRRLVKHGFREPNGGRRTPSVNASELPSIRLGRSLILPEASNAALFAMLDDPIN